MCVSGSFFPLCLEISSDFVYNAQDAAQRVGEALIKTCIDLDINEISSYDRNGFACGERMQAFEIAISSFGILPTLAPTQLPNLILRHFTIITQSLWSAKWSNSFAMVIRRWNLSV